MKTCADLGKEPRFGNIAPCARCGRKVVHGRNGLPYHMHFHSRACREAALQRKSALVDKERDDSER